MRSVFWTIPAIVLFAAVSCDYEPEFLPPKQQVQTDPPPAVSSRFDPATCGRIAGRVFWVGTRPVPPPFLFGVPAPDGNFRTQLFSNPNAPAIVERTRSLSGAVVFLRGLDPASAKPWDHAPVRVEMKDRNIRVVQGDAPARRVGFVRRGDSVAMQSAEPVFHVLRARGAAYFSLAFPEPDQPLTRAFDTAGRVELSSGAGFYWASADLFVAEHPYFTLTDAEGRYAFERVPPGAVEVVVWLPGWDVVKQERDPETGLVSRQTYAAPRERKSKLEVRPNGEAIVDFTLE